MEHIYKIFLEQDRGTIMRQCMDAENLHRRLKKIIGQVQAIDRMVEEDIACEDMLSQINAAKSALHRVGQIVLEGHLHHCVLDGIENGRQGLSCYRRRACSAKKGLYAFGGKGGGDGDRTRSLQ